MVKRKVLIVFILMMLMCTLPVVRAEAGYIYTHDNKPIYSDKGLIVSNVYKFGDLGLRDADFRSPADLFLFKKELRNEFYEFLGYEEKLYLVDSISNKMFIFDMNLSLLKIMGVDDDPEDAYVIDAFELDKTKFTYEEALKINTNRNGLRTPLIIREVDGAEVGVVSFEDFQATGASIALNGASGVFRGVVRTTGEDYIYICDTNNQQILVLDSESFKVVRVISTPQAHAFKTKAFLPFKMVADSSGRLYVISSGINEGIIKLSPTGEFYGFTGVNKVALSAWEIFWRNISTEAQLSQSTQVLNQIFNSLCIDSANFIYTTAGPTTNTKGLVTNDRSMIKKLNPAESDVLKRNGYNVPKGDIVYLRTTQATSHPDLTAIAVNDYGIYTVADAANGRLFTYDAEGNLLYISGGKGTQINELDNPVALVYQGEKILLIDKNSKALMVFQPTDIGAIINKAVKYYVDGDYIESAREWQKVVQKNANYQYAYVGIGKTLMYEGEYVEALDYFELGYNKDLYSRAYKLYRDDKIKANFTAVMYVVLVLCVGLIGLSVYKRIKRGSYEDSGIGDE